MSGPDRAMQPKAPDAFRTISEVGEDLGLPQHVLRFWETRFPAIRPLKRGGGRRYYRPDDVDLLRGIQALLYGQGYTIRGVQRILKQGGPRAVQAIGRGEPADIPSPQVVDDDEPESVAEPEAGTETTASPGLPSDAARRLRAVLDDLAECRRMLQAARSAPDD